MSTQLQETPARQVSRRQVLQILGAGLLIAVTDNPLTAQVETGAIPRGRAGRGGRGGRGGADVPISARLHIGADGTITMMTGKVECGQGARAQIAQAAAEELGVSPTTIRLIMADTLLCPDDGPTYGSATAPNTLPRVRRGAAAARQALIDMAAVKWAVPRDQCNSADGKIVHSATSRQFTYAELVGDNSDQAFKQSTPSAQQAMIANDQWKVMGTPVVRPDAMDLVTGRHKYPSDIVRPGMLYGRVLRPPTYNAHLENIDLAPAQAMKDVIVTRDEDFVGVAAPTNFAAMKAIAALQKTAVWTKPAQIASTELFDHLLKNAQGGSPANPYAKELAASPKSLKRQYNVLYIQHAPLEPRSAVAEWTDGKLTVWTGSQNPWGVRTELMREFSLTADQTRVIIPDFGGGFGGKHTGEAAYEAARIAKAAGKPVWIRWSRQDEFTWAYFRPAGVLLAEAALDSTGKIANFFFVNINSGNAGVATPYNVESNCYTTPSNPPLKQGSYRGLAISANNFARECFMDELAELAGADPLTFRVNHLTEPRLKTALQTAADKFGFAAAFKNKRASIGVGLACGTEKGSYVAACAEVSVDSATKEVKVLRVTQTFDCGAIVNPSGLMSQVQGAIMMGLGGILREAIAFKDGKITNATFADYPVPRFADVPQLDVHLIDHRDQSPAGAGETPIMAIGPAVANAVWHATGKRVREMPIKL